MSGAVIQNSDLEILTPDGWSDFVGIRKKRVSKIMTIILADGSILECTRNHLLLTSDGHVRADSLQVDDVVITADGSKVRISYCEVSCLDGEYEVYDPVQVAKKHQYVSGNFVSHNCSFLGSSNTLIDGDVLERLTWEAPIEKSPDDSMAIWERPKPGHTYALVVDVAHGQGLDYSTFHVIDVTTVPYVQVARYKNNLISPLVFPTLIARVGEEYNEAFVMVEINDIGAQVADILHNELAYENLMKMAPKNKGQQQVSGGYGQTQKRIQYGIKTSTSTKRLGCANLKTLIEQNKLILKDFETIRELTTFISTLQSFAAEPGMHDDLSMALVQFAWLAAQRYFREAAQSNATMDIRTVLEREHLEMDESEKLFFGVWDNGQESNEGGFFLSSDEDTLDDYGKTTYDRIPEKGQGVPERKEPMKMLRSVEDLDTSEAVKHMFPDWSPDTPQYQPSSLVWGKAIRIPAK